MPAGSLTVRRLEPEQVSVALDLARDAEHIDGTDPFNEQTRLDLASARRSAFVAETGEAVVAAAVTGDSQLDLVVSPGMRGRGYGSSLLSELLPDLEADVSAWSHGDHPAARALAARHDFEAVRTLLGLRLRDLAASVAGEPVQPADGMRISAFDPDRDASDWLRLNARTFAEHPEQGAVTAADLGERMAESWFDPQDFLVARTADGTMVGYDWLKLEPGSDEGEIYVLGVDPQAAGRGLGRALLDAGLRRMLVRGRTRAALYVEGDNERALPLYRHAGFVDHTVDVQYRRSAPGHSLAG